MAARQANGQRLIQQIQRGAVPEAIAVNMINSVVRGIQEAGERVGPMARSMADAMKTIPETRVKAANMELASMAQRAVVDGWRSRLPENAPGYRRGPDPNRDRLSGLLGPALGSGDMLRATTARTISFLNVAYLNRETRHWYRVNYGAFGANVGTPTRPAEFPVNINGHTLFVLQDEQAPAPHSWLPRAFVAEGTSWFQPTKGPADVVGGGHRAALFTDLGFESIATNFGPVYDNMFRAMINDAAGRARLERAGIQIPTDLHNIRATVTGF